MWLCTRQSNLGSSPHSVARAKLQRYLIRRKQRYPGICPGSGQAMPRHYTVVSS
jgi:hypothetical protein